MADGERRRILEIELQALIFDVLNHRGFFEVRTNPRLASRLRPDFLASDGERDFIVEVKANTPQTHLRVVDAVDQLTAYRSAVEAQQRRRHIQAVLVVPGRISRRYQALLEAAGIELWDLDFLLGAIEELPKWRGASLRGALLDESDRWATDREADSRFGEDLISRLSLTPCGRPNWSAYQKLCAEILAYLFCPPLEAPIYESVTASRANRRDIILPNYCDDGFWAFMQTHYGAAHVVVDSKNWCNSIDKPAILQMANYLTAHGAGLFGLVLSRSGTESHAAIVTRREQWILNRKMIVVLDDDDLIQMITSRQSGGQPETVLRQRIEDFRLSF